MKVNGEKVYAGIVLFCVTAIVVVFIVAWFLSSWS